MGTAEEERYRLEAARANLGLRGAGSRAGFFTGPRQGGASVPKGGLWRAEKKLTRRLDSSASAPASNPGRTELGSRHGVRAALGAGIAMAEGVSGTSCPGCERVALGHLSGRPQEPL